MNVHATGLNIEYTARGTFLGPKLRNLAEAELGRIDRMLGGAVSAHVILSEDKYRKIAEVTLNTCSETLVATCEHTDMMTALHETLKKIEQQARSWLSPFGRRMRVTHSRKISVSGSDIALPQRATSLVESAENFDGLFGLGLEHRGNWHALVEHSASSVEPRERRVDLLYLPAPDHLQGLFRRLAKILILSVKQQAQWDER